MNGDLRDVIRDGWGRLSACAVQADRRVMDIFDGNYLRLSSSIQCFRKIIQNAVDI